MLSSATGLTPTSIREEKNFVINMKDMITFAIVSINERGATKVRRDQFLMI